MSHETYERFRAVGQTSPLKPSSQSFYAANGSSVVVAGETQLQGYVLATAHGNTQPASMSLTAVVGSTQHDIISTNQCVARGWTFAFSQDASCMKHEASGLAVNEITSWGGCPWVVFTPTISELSAVLAKPAPQLSDRLLQPISQVPKVSGDVTAQHHEPPMSPISKVVEPLEAVQLGKLSESEMLAHRLKGHVPYASWCEHCVKAGESINTGDVGQTRKSRSL